MEKYLFSFEALIRRSIAPSVTFLVLAGAAELLTVEVERFFGASELASSEVLSSWVEFLGDQSENGAGLFALVTLLIVVGLSYGLSAAQFYLFGHRLRQNYDPGFRNRSFSFLSKCNDAIRRRMPLLKESWAIREVEILQALRKRSLERLRSEPALAELHEVADSQWTDYMFYEVLGGICNTDTRAFVDSAKSSGVFFASLIVVTGWNVAINLKDLAPAQLVLLLTLGLCAIGLFFLLGRAVTLAQYRTRAIRLYVNFLAMPPDTLLRQLGCTNKSQSENE